MKWNMQALGKDQFLGLQNLKKQPDSKAFVNSPKRSQDQLTD